MNIANADQDRRLKIHNFSFDRVQSRTNKSLYLTRPEIVVAGQSKPCNERRLRQAEGYCPYRLRYHRPKNFTIGSIRYVVAISIRSFEEPFEDRPPQDTAGGKVMPWFVDAPRQDKRQNHQWRRQKIESDTFLPERSFSVFE